MGGEAGAWRVEIEDRKGKKPGAKSGTGEGKREAWTGSRSRENWKGNVLVPNELRVSGGRAREAWQREVCRCQRVGASGGVSVLVPVYWDWYG